MLNLTFSLQLRLRNLTLESGIRSMKLKGQSC